MVPKFILFAGFWTNCTAIVVEVEAVAKGAHPAMLLGGVAHDQSIARNVFGHHGTCSDKGEGSNVMAAHDGGIGSNGRAAAYMGLCVLVSANDCASRVGYVCENAGWTQKDIVVARDASVQTHVVLNLAIAAQFDFRADDHILANVTAIPQFSQGHDVAKVPDFDSFSDDGAFVNNGGLVREIMEVVGHQLRKEVKSLCSVFLKSASESPRK